MSGLSAGDSSTTQAELSVSLGFRRPLTERSSLASKLRHGGVRLAGLERLVPPYLRPALPLCCEGAVETLNDYALVVAHTGYICSSLHQHVETNAACYG
jgi:hypothetical protein